MKKYYVLAISLMLLSPLLIVGSLGAVVNENNPPTPPAEGEAQVMSTTEEPAGQPASEAVDVKKVEERVDQRRVERNFRLAYAEQVKTKERCRASQGVLKSLSGRITGVETSRSQVHTNLLERLNRAAERLRQENIDTAELEAQITVLQSHLAAFDTELANYKLIISDLVHVDCQQSPVGFRASIEAARESRQKTIQASAVVKTYLQETLKPSLQQLRSQLSTAQSTGQENS